MQAGPKGWSQVNNYKWTTRNILFGLHETPGIGQRTIRKIIAGGKLSECPSFGIAEWMSLGLNQRQAEAVCSQLLPEVIGRIGASYEAAGIAVIAYYDEAYPQMLKEIADPPWVLYAKGDTALLKRLSVAVVGTRVPTAYGRHTAESLAEALSSSGITVVSGLAKGIDTQAHEGGLRGAGSTIAVLGTPVNVPYPPENLSLYKSIAQRGLLISEYPLGTASHPGLFPQRNRIIAGLTCGTVVVEAAARSGSLITADLALEYNREVFAVPGPVSSPKSAGTNGLIRQGAKLIVSASDIMEELQLTNVTDGTSMQFEIAPPKSVLPAAELSPEERKVVRLLQERPHTADELMEKLELSFGHLHAVLINLSIKRKIEQHIGSLYSAL
jgi:DNA processing protein